MRQYLKGVLAPATRRGSSSFSESIIIIVPARLAATKDPAKNPTVAPQRVLYKKTLGEAQLFFRESDKGLAAGQLTRVFVALRLLITAGNVHGAEYASEAATASGRSRLFGDLVWVFFVGAQAADGVCTYVGLRTFGIGMEGNPLIGWYAATFGIGPALVSAKLVAATCAAFLHTVGRHITLASLTIVYLIGAIRPWVEILWP